MPKTEKPESRAVGFFHRSALMRFLAKRIAIGAFLVFGATAITFVLTNLVPGDPALAALGDAAIGNPDAVAAFNEKYHIDDPLPVRYWIYLQNLLAGDFGVSQRTGSPVAADLQQFIPATMELALMSLLIAIVVGIFLGILSALRQGKFSDQLIRVLSLSGVSMPAFWLALIGLYWLSFRLHLFPGVGRLDPIIDPPPTVTGFYTVDSLIAGEWSTFGNAFSHLMLPAIVLAAHNIGMVTRFTRAAVLQVTDEDYIRNARAKGLGSTRVVLSHMLRAALVPVLTLLGLLFGSALSGSILIEKIFSWPGLGQYAYNSSVSLDLPAIAAVALFVAVVYVLVNILVDLIAGLLDPRIGIGGNG